MDHGNESNNCSSLNELFWNHTKITTGSNNNNDCVRFANTTTDYNWTFLLVITLILAGCLGNLLVCFAVSFDRRLQNVTNYFLFSLAIADLLVTLVVMPLGAIPGFLGYWPFGLFWCNVYVTCDVLACSASIMHMCFISLSRYLGIRNPLKSRQSITKRFVIMKIILVWLLSMLISSSITILGIINHDNIMPKAHLCVINNRAFFIFGSMASFYIPMIVMVTTYILTLKLLRTKSTHFAQSLTQDKEREVISRHLGRGIQKYKVQHAASTSTTFTNNSQESEKWCPKEYEIPRTNSGRQHDNVHKETIDNDKQSKKNLKIVQLAKFSISPLCDTFLQKCNAFAPPTLANERKASKVLGIVFFTFVFCWAPFFILNIIFAICHTCSTTIPDKIINICLWLGYVSSTINPIIYTIFNANFRNTFFTILRCQWSKLKQPSRYRTTIINQKTNNFNFPRAYTIPTTSDPIFMES